MIQPSAGGSALGAVPAAEPHRVLRLLALVAVSLGVVVLAAAAFVLSYSGIRAVALEAGVSPTLARIYPLMFDAMLVVAGAAVLSLRGAEWIVRAFAWLSLLVLLAAAAGASTLHATNTHLPHKTAAAVAAILPWALALLGFFLLLAMLRHARLRRAQSRRATSAAAVAQQPDTIPGAVPSVLGAMPAAAAAAAGEHPAFAADDGWPDGEYPDGEVRSHGQTAELAATGYPGDILVAGRPPADDTDAGAPATDEPAAHETAAHETAADEAPAGGAVAGAAVAGAAVAGAAVAGAAADEPAADEPAAHETAADEAPAGGAVAGGAVAGAVAAGAAADETAADEPADHRSAPTVPAQALPVQPEPTSTERASTEPVSTRPADTEPADAEPADAEPADTEPADTEPADTEPTGIEPADTEPADTGPADTGPADTGPAGAGPASTSAEAGGTTAGIPLRWPGRSSADQPETDESSLDSEPGQDDPVSDEAHPASRPGVVWVPRAREEPSDEVIRDEPEPSPAEPAEGTGSQEAGSAAPEAAEEGTAPAGPAGAATEPGQAGGSWLTPANGSAEPAGAAPEQPGSAPDPAEQPAKPPVTSFWDSVFGPRTPEGTGQPAGTAPAGTSQEQAGSQPATQPSETATADEEPQFDRFRSSPTPPDDE